MAERKAFNFYASYFDVYNQLKTDKDKLAFIDALLNKQFYGEDPEGLTGMVLFAYESQKQVINQQVEGFEKKTKTTLSRGVAKGGAEGGSVQEKGEGEEEEKEEVEQAINVFDYKTIENKFKEWGKKKDLCPIKVLEQFDNAWDYYEDKLWKNSKGKEVKDPFMTIRNNWFKELHLYKKKKEPKMVDPEEWWGRKS